MWNTKHEPKDVRPAFVFVSYFVLSFRLFSNLLFQLKHQNQKFGFVLSFWSNLYISSLYITVLFTVPTIYSFWTISFAFGKHIWFNYFPVNIYLFTVTNRNTRKRCEICSKITTNTREQRHCHRSVVFIFHIGYFEQCQLGYLYIFDAALDISLTWPPLIDLSVSGVHKKVTHI